MLGITARILFVRLTFIFSIKIMEWRELGLCFAVTFKLFIVGTLCF